MPDGILARRAKRAEMFAVLVGVVAWVVGVVGGWAPERLGRLELRLRPRAGNMLCVCGAPGWVGMPDAAGSRVCMVGGGVVLVGRLGRYRLPPCPDPCCKAVLLLDAYDGLTRSRSS